MGNAARVKSIVSVLLLFVMISGTFAFGSDSAIASEAEPVSGNRAARNAPERIISLAPSITEVLFALGVGNKVVGVTRYCDYPPEAGMITRVGGYFDINYEAILSLEPDLVVLLTEHEDARANLRKMGIGVMTVDHSSMDGIMESIGTVARVVGAAAEGARLQTELEVRIARVASAFKNSLRPRVMVAVGRRMDGGNIGEIYISGKDGFYDKLITLAGGVNAYQDSTMKFPAISVEGIVRLDPDVIVEMVPDAKGDNVKERLASHWLSLPSVKAVEEGRIFIFTEDYVVVPGPRFVLLLEELARALHPEIDWGLN